MPSRDEFKKVYALILNSKTPVERDLIECKLHYLGCGKISVIIDAFLQYGLIIEDGTKYFAPQNTKKVDITKADIIKKIESFRRQVI